MQHIQDSEVDALDRVLCWFVRIGTVLAVIAFLLFIGMVW